MPLAKHTISDKSLILYNFKVSDVIIYFMKF